MKGLPLVLTMLVSGGLSAQESKAPASPQPSGLVSANAHAFSYGEQGLAGPGAGILRNAAAASQFVLLGEMHGDHEIPQFAGALFRVLQGELGYRTLVVEQDPVAIEDALSPALRGDVDRLATHARRYNTLFEFDSDEDLALLAQVARGVKGPDAIWGVEQAPLFSRKQKEQAIDETKKLLVEHFGRDGAVAQGGPQAVIARMLDEAGAEFPQCDRDPCPEAVQRTLPGLRSFGAPAFQ